MSYNYPGQNDPGQNYPGQNYPGQVPGYQGGPPVYGQQRTNPLAIVSLCLGIAQIILGLIAGIPALICGIIALNQIKARGERGRGAALAGVILSCIGIVLFIVVIIAVVAGHSSNS